MKIVFSSTFFFKGCFISLKIFLFFIFMVEISSIIVSKQYLIYYTLFFHVIGIPYFIFCNYCYYFLIQLIFAKLKYLQVIKHQVKFTSIAELRV
jgi:hypothetical protein